MSDPTDDFTRLLHAWQGGDRGALHALMPTLHALLRRSAADRVDVEHDSTLDPAGRVHEALLRLRGARDGEALICRDAARRDRGCDDAVGADGGSRSALRARVAQSRDGLMR